MAAPTFLGYQTSTVSRPELFQTGTSPLAEPVLDKAEQAAEPTIKSRTLAEVDEKEKGDPLAKDRNTLLNGESADILRTLAIATRQSLAKALYDAVARILPNVGTSRMASQLQLLKRELAKGHDTLGPIKTEADFLSIIVFVEMVLGKKHWREISKPELEEMKAAFKLGVTEPAVTFDHANQFSRIFTNSGWIEAPEFEPSEDNGHG